MLLPFTGQGSQTQVNVTGEGGTGAEVGGARGGRGARPGGGAPHFTTRTSTEGDRAVFH